MNYGGIGAVIGHEMTHGFDDQGRKSDADGNLRDWWAAADATAYNERARKVVEQFSNYRVLNNSLAGERGPHPGRKQSPTSAASRSPSLPSKRPRPPSPPPSAPRRSTISPPSSASSSATPNCGAAHMTPEAIQLRIKTDPHSPAGLRVNGPLSNLDDFATAFTIPEGAPMRRSATQRVAIW